MPSIESHKSFSQPALHHFLSLSRACMMDPDSHQSHVQAVRNRTRLPLWRSRRHDGATCPNVDDIARNHRPASCLIEDEAQLREHRRWRGRPARDDPRERTCLVVPAEGGAAHRRRRRVVRRLTIILNHLERAVRAAVHAHLERPTRQRPSVLQEGHEGNDGARRRIHRHSGEVVVAANHVDRGSP